MTDYEMRSLAISALTALIALGGLTYAGFQLRLAREYGELSYEVHRAEHDWNRRLAAQNALKDYAQSVALGGLQNELHNMLNAYEGTRKEPRPPTGVRR